MLPVRASLERRHRRAGARVRPAVGGAHCGRPARRSTTSALDAARYRSISAAVAAVLVLESAVALPTTPAALVASALIAAAPRLLVVAPWREEAQMVVDVVDEVEERGCAAEEDEHQEELRERVVQGGRATLVLAGGYDGIGGGGGGGCQSDVSPTTLRMPRAACLAGCGPFFVLLSLACDESRTSGRQRSMSLVSQSDHSSYASEDETVDVTRDERR